MSRSKLKIVYFCSCLFLVGCASYKVPIQVENHPASTDAEIVQVKLSPILDLKNGKPVCKPVCHFEQDIQANE